MSASRGEERIPLPIRSMKRRIRTTGQTVARPMKGLKKLDRLYPKTTRGLRLESRSAQKPEKTFNSEAVDSATPSMMPRAAGPAPKTWDKKIGRIGKNISVEASVKRLTNPRRMTARGIFFIRKFFLK